MIQAPKKKKKMNPLLMKVIVVSLVLHLVGGVVAGFVTFVNYIKNENMFKEPPPEQVEEPPPEVKTTIEPEQPKEQFEQNLAMPSVADISIGNLDLSIPDMDDSFSVSAAIGGIGGSLLGNARGSMNIGLSTVDIFGSH